MDGFHLIWKINGPMMVGWMCIEVLFMFYDDLVRFGRDWMSFDEEEEIQFSRIPLQVLCSWSIPPQLGRALSSLFGQTQPVGRAQPI